MNTILASLAPTLASALLGPLGGVAVAALGKVFGIDNATTETVAKVFQDGKLTPEQLSQIKTLEMQYQNDEKERGFKYAELAFKDVDSARGRDVEFLKAGKRNVRADVLAYGALIAFVLSGAALFYATLPPANRELLVYLMGALTVIVKDIYGFEFSSTRDSQAKTQMLAQATSPSSSSQ